MTEELTKGSAFWTTNVSKIVKKCYFYVRLFSTTFSCLTLNIEVMDHIQPSIRKIIVKIIN